MKFIERSIILLGGPHSKRWTDLRGRWPRGQSPSQATLEDKRGRALGAEKGNRSVVLRNSSFYSFPNGNQGRTNF